MNSASSAPIGLDGRCLVVSTMSPTVAWRLTMSTAEPSKPIGREALGQRSAVPIGVRPPEQVTSHSKPAFTSVLSRGNDPRPTPTALQNRYPQTRLRQSGNRHRTAEAAPPTLASKPLLRSIVKSADRPIPRGRPRLLGSRVVVLHEGRRESRAPASQLASELRSRRSPNQLWRHCHGHSAAMFNVVESARSLVLRCRHLIVVRSMSRAEHLRTNAGHAQMARIGIRLLVCSTFALNGY
jgi:hypothetical protein